MTFANFISGSYTAAARAAAADETCNYYPERIEDPNAATKTSWFLLSKPGLKVFSQLDASATSVTAQCEINGRAFAIAGGVLYEVLSDGAKTARGAVGTGRAQMEASQSQVLILVAGAGYLFTLASNTFAAISGFPANIVKIGQSDAYFLALQGNSQTFFFSDLSNGASWNALDFADAEGESGNAVTFVVDHRQLWILCETHAEIYYDSGNATTPWTRLEGAFMEQGAGAVDGACRIDNAIMWLGGNRDGAGMVWRANGYTPQRVSTHAVETDIQAGTFSDATCYCYQEGGHTFWRLDLPTAGKTWLFDVASGLWHRRSYYNPTTNQEQADLARTYMYAFGKHLVGDYQSGTIYEQSQSYYTDAGAPIRRVRQAAPQQNGGAWVYYSEFRLLMQVGMGLDGSVAPGSDPQAILQVSNDGGFTWGNERSVSIGRIGEYNTLVRWRQLGRSKDRVFRVTITEPIFVALVAADLDVHA